MSNEGHPPRRVKEASPPEAVYRDAVSQSIRVDTLGVENVNGAVDATLLAAGIRRVLAQVEVAFSNSMIEAWWRSLKHQWLYLNSLDSIERLRTLVAFFVESHNAQMPHPAFDGQTPDEMYFGTAASLPVELATARTKARVARLAANRALSCRRCVAPAPGPVIAPIPP